MKKRLSPAQTVFLGFLLLILIGTFLLSLPISTSTGSRAKIVDALFTANSAICVTGLVVVDTGKFWSHFGQIVILILIQFGGLGYMTIASLVVLILRKRITLEEKLAFKEGMDQFSMSELAHFIVQIIKVTFLVEGVGAFILFLHWQGRFGLSGAAYKGIFHAISAFCNAGFSLFSNNLEDYRGDVVVSVTIMSLIVIGGIGYTVIRDIYHHLTKRKHRHLFFHTKSVLTMTAILILSGAFFIFFFESINPQVFQQLSLKEKILSSFFQSITPRTAGFNTIPIGQLAIPTLLLLIILMFIGASPGGTGGGIKTTTFLVLISSSWSTIKRRRDVQIFKRRIPEEVIYKSFAIFIIALTLVLIVTFFMLNTEGKGLVPVLFEIVSAFGTVGLSTGITPTLSSAGKLLLIITMFIGRVGLLTFAVAFTRGREEPLYRYPEERILVG